MIHGLVVALATPFRGEGLDERAFADLAEWQVAEGCDALAPCSATGEASTLTPAEHRRLVEIAVEVASSRVPVIAGIVTNCTDRAIAQVMSVKLAGADAALVSLPAYNKPTQEGVYRHVSALARASDLPLIVCNDPGRTALRLGAGLQGRLAEIDAIVGFVGPPGELAPLLSASSTGRRAPSLLAATDDDTLSVGLAGGAGTLSAVANVAPRLVARIHKACRRGAWSRAAELQSQIRPLMQALAEPGEPAALKYALSIARPGFDAQPRLPLVPVSSATAATIAAAIDGLAAYA